MQKLILPFAFDGSPLFRTGIFRTPERLVFFLDVHHMICDGESLRIVLEDILAAGEGQDIPEDAWPRILRGKTAAGDAARESDRAWFENRYRGPHDRLLPADPAGGSHREGRSDYRFSFRSEEAAEAAGRLHLSANGFYLLAAALSMMAYGHTDKVMLSWTSGGRPDRKSMRTVGLLIRDYPLALSAGRDDTVSTMAASVSRQIREAIRHGSVSPYMQPGSDGMFCFLYQGDLLRTPDCRQLLRVDFPEVPEKAAIEPLEFHLHEDAEGPWARILYDAGMYRPESMHRFETVFESICRLLLEKNSGLLPAGDIIRRAAEQV